MAQTIFIAFLFIVTGIIIVALPDTGPRLFSISQEHGPSLVDGIGILFILIGYLILLISAWKRRQNLQRTTYKKYSKVLLYLFGLGTGLLVASVAGDFRQWWVIGCILLGAIQTYLLYLIIKSNSNTF